MKKTATIVAFILLFSMLLSSCNYVKDPPEESGTPSATPEETPAETESSKYDIPNKIYHFEPGFTSIEFAKKLQPFMEESVVTWILQSFTLEYVGSSLPKFDAYYWLIEGGYLYCDFGPAARFIDEMKDREHVSVLKKAWIEYEDGTEEVLFDISYDEKYTEEDIIYGPRIPYADVEKLKPYMTSFEVRALLGDFHIYHTLTDNDNSSGSYVLEDGKHLDIIYDIDDNGQYVLVEAYIVSVIGEVNMPEDIKIEYLFEVSLPQE